MSKWSDLEEFTKKLTSKDKTKRTPLSGATKNEEDVVGNSLICQCKQTDDKNISILEKDLTRLLNAAKLLEKFPIFVSSSKAGTLLSIPITNETEEIIEIIINSIILQARLSSLYLNCSSIKEPRDLMRAQKEKIVLETMADDLIYKNKKLLKGITNKLKTIEDDILSYNLFDGE